MSFYSSFFLSVVLLSSISLHASEGRNTTKKKAQYTKKEPSTKHDELTFNEFQVSAMRQVAKQSQLAKSLYAAIIREDEKAIKDILNSDSRRSVAVLKSLPAATIHGIPLLHYPISKGNSNLVRLFVEKYHVPVNQAAIDCAKKAGRTEVLAYLQTQLQPTEQS